MYKLKSLDGSVWQNKGPLENFPAGVDYWHIDSSSGLTFLLSLGHERDVQKLDPPIAAGELSDSGDPVAPIGAGHFTKYTVTLRVMDPSSGVIVETYDQSSEDSPFMNIVDRDDNPKENQLF